MSAPGLASLGSVCRALGVDEEGRGLQGLANSPIAAIVTDTRRVAADTLFVALKGERFDAHDFIAKAREGGAVDVYVRCEGGLGRQR